MARLSRHTDSKMVNKVKILVCIFAIYGLSLYRLGFQILRGSYVRYKAALLSFLLGVYLIHATPCEGTKKGLEKSGKLYIPTRSRLGKEGASEIFLLIPYLLFSVQLTIKTLNIVSPFMTHGQLLSIAPYVEMYIDTFTFLGWIEVFVKVSFLLQRKYNPLV